MKRIIRFANKTWRFAVIVLLVVVLFFQSSPNAFVALAESVRSGATSESVELGHQYNKIEIPQDNQKQEEAYIQYEEEIMRDYYEKHYYLSNGAYMKEAFLEPIHYKDENGEFKDIDNRLLIYTDDDSNEYVKNASGLYGAEFAANPSSDKPLMSVDKDGFKLDFYLVGDENVGSIREVDTSAIQSIVDTEESQNQADTIDIPQRFESVSFEDVSLSILPANLYSDTQTKASYKNKKLKSSIKNETLRSELVYENLYKGASFEYKLEPNKIKENIIVSSRQSEYKYNFEINSEGLRLFLQDGGNIEAIDEAGNLIFDIPAPYMFDANGEHSQNVHYMLETVLEEQKYILTIQADAAWANASNRAFPITIDPMVVVNITPNAELSSGALIGKAVCSNGTYKTGEENIFISNSSIEEDKYGLVIRYKSSENYGITSKLTLNYYCYSSFANEIVMIYRLSSDLSFSQAKYCHIATEESVYISQFTSVADEYVANSIDFNDREIMFGFIYANNNANSFVQMFFGVFSVTEYYCYDDEFLNDGIDFPGEHFNYHVNYNSFQGSLVTSLFEQDFALAPISIRSIYRRGYNIIRKDLFGSWGDDYGRDWKLNYEQFIKKVNNNLYLLIDEYGAVYPLNLSPHSIVDPNNNDQYDYNYLGDAQYRQRNVYYFKTQNVDIIFNSYNLTVTDSSGAITKHFEPYNGFYRLSKISYLSGANIKIHYLGTRITYISNYLTQNAGHEDYISRIYLDYTDELLTKIKPSILNNPVVLAELSYGVNKQLLTISKYGSPVVNMNYSSESGHLTRIVDENNCGYEIDYELNDDEIPMVTQVYGINRGIIEQYVEFLEETGVRTVMYYALDLAEDCVCVGVERLYFDELGYCIKRISEEFNQDEEICTTTITQTQIDRTDGDVDQRESIYVDLDFSTIIGEDCYIDIYPLLSNVSPLDIDKFINPAIVIKSEQPINAQMQVYYKYTDETDWNTEHINMDNTVVYTLLNLEKRDKYLQIKLVGSQNTYIDYCGIGEIVSKESMYIYNAFTQHKGLGQTMYTTATYTNGKLYRDNSLLFVDSLFYIDDSSRMLVYQYYNGHYFQEGKEHLLRTIGESITNSSGEETTYNHRVITYNDYGQPYYIPQGKGVYDYCEYDEYGNMSYYQRQDGTIILSEYEFIGYTGHRKIIDYEEGDYQKTTYTYDEYGRLLTKANEAGTQEYLYLANKLVGYSYGGRIYEWGKDSNGIENAIIQDSEVMIGYSYSDKGVLESKQFNNGQSMEYLYSNNGDLLSKKSYCEETLESSFSYTYNNRSEIQTISFDDITKTYSEPNYYQKKVEQEEDQDLVYSALYSYDKVTGHLNEKSTVFESLAYTTNYTYDDEVFNRLKSIQSANYKSEYTYNQYNQISNIKKSLAGYVYSNREYTYLGTTGLVSQVKDTSTINPSNYEIEYSYENMFNNTHIISVKSNGQDYLDYAYDECGRLIMERNLALEMQFIYVYDADNNIKMVYEMDLNGTVQKIIGFNYCDGRLITISIRVADTFIIRLIHYTADAYGNHLSYGDYNLSWTRGKMLKSVSFNENDYTYNYFYDENGLRYKKVKLDENGDVSETTKYYLEGDAIVAEYRNNMPIYYYYDESGVMGIQYNGIRYTYVKDILGNIVQIKDFSGNLMAEYTYDAWGNCTIVTNVNGIAEANPFRYKGYYMDSETGFYYLQTRYYDPATRRFISPDNYELLDTLATSSELNLYTYCLNNPVMYSDSSGQSIWAIFIILAVGAIIGGAVNGKIAYDNGARGWELFGEVALGAAIGVAVAGAAITIVSGAAMVVGATTIFGGVAVTQAFAIGALAFNFFAFVVAPILGVTMEGIEYPNVPNPPTPNPTPPISSARPLGRQFKTGIAKYLFV